MPKILKNLKFIFIFFIVFLFFLLAGDYFLSNFFFKKKELIENPHRVQNKFYHHTLLKNFDGLEKWGSKEYRICTDHLGFKTDCLNVNNSSEFDIAFIGDSFTEGIGMEYHDTFVGLFANSAKDLKIANLAVSSYSPSIYFKKIEHLLSSGVKFKHLIVFIDISDIQDEANYYIEDKDNNITSRDLLDSRKRKLIKFKKTLRKNFILTYALYDRIKKVVKKENVSKEEKVFNLDRSTWTSNNEANGYGLLGVSGGIKKSLTYMNRLRQLLDEKDISLSIGIYPWPDQLSEMTNNLKNKIRQVEIWENFCLANCKEFFNLFPVFNKYVAEFGYLNTYKNFYIDGDVHFNKKGNELIYKALQAKINSYR